MYRLARQSVVRFVADAMDNWPNEIKYYEFDGHADGDTLPNKDLFGVIGFSCVANDQFHDITFGVVVMTLDDPGLDRSTKYLDWFYERLQAHRKFPVYLESGATAGFEIICFDGTTVAPVEQADARPTSSIQVSARVTRAGQAPR